MKIAFIVGYFPKISETFILNQITGLLDLGHEVEIFAEYNPREEKVHEDVRTYNLMEKVQYFDVPKDRITRYLRGITFLKSNFLKDPHQVSKSLNVFKYGKRALSFYLLYFSRPFLGMEVGFDIIFCHFGNIGNTGAFIKENFFPQSKLVCMFHGNDIREGIKNGGETIYSPLFQKADCILSISEYNKRYLQKWGAKNILDHPVGIDTSYFTNEKPKVKNNKTVKLLSIGRLSEEKGYYYALDAVSLLIQGNLDREIIYDIVGDGPLKEKLVEYVHENKLGKNVVFHGSKNREEILNFYRNTDLFLLSSVSEALPVVIMEAQACEIPVVATDVGSVNEEVENGKSGFLVPPKDPKALFEKLDWFLKNEDKWVEMGKEGRRIIEQKYSQDKLNKKLEKIFYDLIIS